MRITITIMITIIIASFGLELGRARFWAIDFGIRAANSPSWKFPACEMRWNRGADSPTEFLKN